jgi:NAD(P)-dependent dehydrogenase (short-subunit alcohol dehydrogenase family)
MPDRQRRWKPSGGPRSETLAKQGREDARTFDRDGAGGRIGVPRDVTQTLRWLASEDAGHITAQVIQVNGGAERSR